MRSADVPGLRRWPSARSQKSKSAQHGLVGVVAVAQGVEDRGGAGGDFVGDVEAALAGDERVGLRGEQFEIRADDRLAQRQLGGGGGDAVGGPEDLGEVVDVLPGDQVAVGGQPSPRGA